jgi:hypothetical protein
MVAAFLIAAPLSIPVTRIWWTIKRRQERRFAMDMKAANRSVSWTEACSRVENGQGCLISDHLSMKGPVRLWWTSDDVAVITPYACFFEEFPDSLEPLNSEFDMWCRSRYTNAELGTALLVELSSTTTRVAPVSRRKAFSWSSAQICELERNTSKRTDLRL